MKTLKGSVYIPEMDKEEVLIYDIECATVGPKPDADKDILKLFGFYSYKTGKHGIVPYTDKKAIQKIIDNHKFLVGFNNENYDDPILKRSGISLEYKRIIDLRKIFKLRAGGMITKKGMLGNVLMRYSLDYITRFLDLVDEDTAKDEIDYDIFKKNSWTHEEVKKMREYTERDIEITKKLYEWVEDYFESFKDFVPENDVKKKYYLTDTIAKFAYKAICHALGWEPIYDSEGIKNVNPEDKISGGYVAYPAGEKFEGDIYCLDFNCFPKGTKIRMAGKSGADGHYYDKQIQNVKPGDRIINQDGVQIVGGVRSQDYDGDLIVIELENGKSVRCTPDHKFPVIRDGKECVVEAQDLKDSDDLLTTNSKYGKYNGNYKGKIQKICEVCGTEYSVFPSQDIIKTCSAECSNVLRSLNNQKTNLGKTKHDTPHLMKMSKERTGVPRTDEHKNKISKATKKAMESIDMSEINKNRNMDFMNTIEWRQKIVLSRMQSVKDGKFRYKNINFRSNWEVIVAKNMDKHGIKWKYEPRVFKLDDGIFYLPDFYLPDQDKWLEVKGYMYDHSREKIQKFMETHDLILIDSLNKVKDEDIKWLKLEA